MDEIEQTKLLSALILFFMTLTCGYVPVRTIVNQNFIQYAMYGGGGVLMATAFCHLIPETHDNYKHVSDGDKISGGSQTLLTTPLPLAPVMSATNITMTTNNSSTPTTTIHLTPSTAAHSHSDSAAATTATPPPMGSNISNALHLISSLNVPYVEVTLCCGFFFMYIVELLMVRFVSTHTHQHPCDTSLVQLYNGSDCGARGNSNTNGVAQTGTQSQPSGYVSNNNNSTPSVTGGTSGVVVVGGSASSTTISGTGFYKFIRGLLIVSAFVAHALFDGVAIGSQETVEKVWTVFVAISCHKLIIAAVVGLELYAATLESHLWTVVHLSLFSIMSPIGIVLVVVAQNSLHLREDDPAMILLQSFATGTLLYIIFVEILQPKGDHALEKNRLGKSISLVAGFALMLVALTLMSPE